MKKQKEEFDVAVLKLQERITILELEKDHLEQHGCRVCVRIDDVLLNPRKQYIVFMKRLVNSLGKHVQIYLCLVLTEPTSLSLNTNHTEIKRNVAAS